MPAAAAVEAAPIWKLCPLRELWGTPALRAASRRRLTTTDLVSKRPDWKTKSGPRGRAARKWLRIAVTAQTCEAEHAITSVCPWWKASVLEALRKIDICCGQARLGWNDTQSADKSNCGRNLKVPWYVNSLHRRNAKKARVKAAQIIEKSRSPNHVRSMGWIASSTPGVTGWRRTRVWPW